MPKHEFRDEDDGGSEEEEEQQLDEHGNTIGEDYTLESGKALSKFRMYENEFPEIDEVVMVQVRSIADMGAYVSLLEYNNIEGMILLSEVSRRRIRSINKLIRVGKQEVCMVLRVDKEKGYIDLSKRRVSAEDIQQCDDRFTRSKAVHSIVRHVADTQSVEMEALYEKTAWPLYRKYGHAYEAFRAAITDPDSIFNEETMPGLEAHMREAMLVDIAKRLTPTAVKIRADIEVTCFHYEGINAIKRALKKGTSKGSEECPIKIKLLAPPLYVMTCSALEKSKGIEILEEAIKEMKAEINAAKGELQVKAAPRAVDERDDKLLSSLMSALEQQNAEIGGDDEEEEEDEGMGNIDIA